MTVCIQVLSEFLSVFYLVYVVVVPTTHFLLLKWKGIHFTLDGVFKKHQNKYACTIQYTLTDTKCLEEKSLWIPNTNIEFFF